MTNEQKFTNAEERNAAYRAYITDFTKPIIGQFEWLALEAEEEEPKSCPFCGGTTEVITDKQGYYGVSCIHCDYTSERYEQSIYAIAAHNRICRAVEAVKKGDMK